MTRYAKVDGGAVVQVGLPDRGVLSNGRQVTNYHRLPEEILLGEGWLPLEETRPEYDPDRQDLVDEGYEVFTSKVVQKWGVYPRSKYLTSDRDEIPPDGSTPALVSYRDPSQTTESVVFMVNGTPSQDTPMVNGSAEIYVVSNTPDDVVLVEANGLTLTIGVTDA